MAVVKLHMNDTFQVILINNGSEADIFARQY